MKKIYLSFFFLWSCLATGMENESKKITLITIDNKKTEPELDIALKSKVIKDMFDFQESNNNTELPISITKKEWNELFKYLRMNEKKYHKNATEETTKTQFNTLIIADKLDAPENLKNLFTDHLVEKCANAKVSTFNPIILHIHPGGLLTSRNQILELIDLIEELNVPDTVASRVSEKLAPKLLLPKWFSSKIFEEAYKHCKTTDTRSLYQKPSILSKLKEKINGCTNAILSEDKSFLVCETISSTLSSKAFLYNCKNPDQPTCLKQLDNFPGALFDKKTNFFAYTDAQGNCQIYKINAKKDNFVPFGKIASNNPNKLCFAEDFSTENTYLATTKNTNKTLYISHIKNTGLGQSLKLIEYDKRIRHVQFLPTMDNMFIVIREDDVVELHKIYENQEIWKRESYNERIDCFALSPDDNYYAQCKDNAIFIYEIDTEKIKLKQLTRLKHAKKIENIKFTQNKELIFTDNCKAHILNIDKLAIKQKLSLKELLFLKLLRQLNKKEWNFARYDYKFTNTNTQNQFEELIEILKDLPGIINQKDTNNNND